MNEHTRQAIKEASENGYWYAFDRHRDEDIPAVLLDKDFWSALGKARGWEAPETLTRCYECDCKTQQDGTWCSYWHRFIDHLADGKDAESFFVTLA